jgi:hypothetical protein
MLLDCSKVLVDQKLIITVHLNGIHFEKKLKIRIKIIEIAYLLGRKKK